VSGFLTLRLRRTQPSRKMEIAAQWPRVHREQHRWRRMNGLSQGGRCGTEAMRRNRAPPQAGDPSFAQTSDQNPWPLRGDLHFS
jgi:hypothetical protein